MSNRIRNLRKQKGLTLEELGKIVGVKKNTLSRYENNINQPKKETWKKLADYFDVSVPYIKGLIFSRDEIIEIIHEYYFRSAFLKNKNLFGSNFVDNVNSYIRLNSTDKIPIDLYSKGSKKFPLSSEIRKYWYRNFKDILNTEAFKSLPKKGEDYPSLTYKEGVFLLFAVRLENSLNELSKKNGLTPLGAFYEINYGNEDEKLRNTLNKIKFFDLDSAKVAINEFSDYVDNLKKEINSFEPSDTYYDQYLEKIIKANVVNENIDDHEKIGNQILLEINKRVKNGDKKLRNYLINSDLGIFHAYKQYKIENKENITLIDKYI